MDDLISREAAIEFANDQMLKETGTYTKGRNAGLRIMKSALNNPDAIPSVPAVPLEPLCKYLAGYAAPPIRSPLAIYGSFEEAWKAFLMKWMEEQDAAG